MRIKLFRKNGDPEIVDDATLLVVEDDRGTPVSIACDLGIAGAFEVACIDNRNFSDVLKKYGIDRTVVRVDARQFLKPSEELPQL